MLELIQTSEGVLLRVRAKPGSRRNGITGEHAGALKIAVNAPPEKGKANLAIVEILATVLKLKKSDVVLVRGEANQDKVFLLHGVTLPVVHERTLVLLDTQCGSKR